MKPDPYPQRMVAFTTRWTTRALAVCGLAASIACGWRTADVDLGPQPDLGFLNASVVMDKGITVVPGTRWTTTPDGSAWVFRSYAEMLVWVRSTPEHPLVFLFTPDTATTEHHFEARWDLELLFAAAAPSRYGSRLEVQPHLLQPGLHRLTLRRVLEHDAIEVQARSDNVFPGLGFELDTRATTIRADDAARHVVVARLLDLGVTGRGPERMSGCLFDGRGTARASVSLARPATIEWRPHNLSSRPAVFRASADANERSVVVEAGGTGRLRLPVPAGPVVLRLDVEGQRRGLFLWGAPHVQAGQAPLPPIVVVTLDTVRRDAVSPYGAEGVTPAIAAFAERSTVFDNAIAASPWTLPSHGSIFTGLYPRDHDGGVGLDRLPHGAVTLAEVLRDHGYLTVGLAGGELCSSRWGLGQGFDVYRDPDGFESRGDVLTDAAASILAEVGTRPLFLFVNYFDAHALYRAPAEFQERFRVAELASQARQVPGWQSFVDHGSIETWTRIIEGDIPAPPEGVAYLRAAYLAEVAFVDAQVEDLLALLDRYGLLEPALVILVSDHGELLGEGGFFSHGCRLDPELLEVPLIVKWPGQTSGRRTGQLVSHVDLFELVLSVVLGKDQAREGLDLAASVPDLKGRDAVLSEEHERWFHPLFRRMRVARDLWGIQIADWRMVEWDGGCTSARREGQTWVDTDCERARSERGLSALSRALETKETAHEEVLDEAEAAALRALGYLPH